MNRSEVQAELKQVISEAFAAHTLWTTDWAGVQLKRCRLLIYNITHFPSAELFDLKPIAEGTSGIQ